MANRDILVLNTTQSRAETQQSSDTVRIKGDGEILSIENSSASPILTVQSSGSQTTLEGKITSTKNITGVISGSFGKVEGTTLIGSAFELTNTDLEGTLSSSAQIASKVTGSFRQGFEFTGTVSGSGGSTGSFDRIVATTLVGDASNLTRTPLDNTISGSAQIASQISGAFTSGFEFDGTIKKALGTWSATNTINTARTLTTAFGSQNATVLAGGNSNPVSPGAHALSETWNGTNWSEGNDLNSKRMSAASAGTATSGLVFGGSASPGNNLADTETYDGTDYSEVNNLTTGRYTLGGFGTQNSAIAAGGAVPGYNNICKLTECWNGSNWSEVNDMINPRWYFGSAGDSSESGIIFGGSYSPQFSTGIATTEQWNGSSWSEVNDLNVNLLYTRGNGSTNNAIVAGGLINSPTNTFSKCTEAWDGTSWSIEGSLNVASRYLGIGGNADGAIAAGFSIDPSPYSATNSELFQATFTTGSFGKLVATTLVGSAANLTNTTKEGTISSSAQIASRISGSFNKGFEFDGEISASISGSVSLGTLTAQTLVGDGSALTNTISTGTVTGSAQLASDISGSFNKGFEVAGNISGSSTSSGSFGRVEAIEFAGSGANITNIPLPTGLISGSAQLSANISGSFTSGFEFSNTISGSATSTGSFGRLVATTFTGDGSGLTNTDKEGTISSSAQLASRISGSWNMGFQYKCQIHSQLGSWSAGGDMNEVRTGGGGIGNCDAFIVAAGRNQPYDSPGGNPYQTISCVESYNGSSWSEVNNLNLERTNIMAAGTTTSGIIAGGFRFANSACGQTETWNGTNWSETGDMLTATGFSGDAGTSADTMLVFGGATATPTSHYTDNAEEYNGSSWSEISELNGARSGLAGLGNTEAALAVAGNPTPGGHAPGNGFAAEEWNGSNWTAITQTLTANSETYLNTGVKGAGTVNDAHAFGGFHYFPSQPTTRYDARSQHWDGTSWSYGGRLITGRTNIAGNGSGGGDALAAGGDNPTIVACTEEYNAFYATASFGTVIANCLSGNASTLDNVNFPAGTISSSAQVDYEGAFNEGFEYTGEIRTAKGAWSVGASPASLRHAQGAAGVQSAMLAGGGAYPGTNPAGSPAYASHALSEEYNGSTWSETNDMITARAGVAAAGTQNAALFATGDYTTHTEEYNGTNYATGNATNQARQRGGGAGTQNAGLAAGGYHPNGATGLASTELYDGASWSNTADLNAVGAHLQGGGSQNASIMIGKYDSTNGSRNCTEIWNGTVWTEVSDQVGFRSYSFSGGGTVNAATKTGGRLCAPFPSPYVGAQTERWDGVSWAIDTDLPGNARGQRSGGSTPSQHMTFGGENAGDGPANYEYNDYYTTGSFGRIETPDVQIVQDSQLVVSASLQLPVFASNSGIVSSSAGQMWFNSTTKKLNFTMDVNSFSAGGNMNLARAYVGGTGTQNAALAVGGDASGDKGETELYNGSAWSESGDLDVTRWGLAATGTQTSALAFGGYDSPATTYAKTEAFSGTTWAECADMNQARVLHAGIGTQNAALAAAGYTNASEAELDDTEEWNGSAWYAAADNNTARRKVTGAGSQNAGIIFGGSVHPAMSKLTETYDGTTWTERNDMVSARAMLGGAGSQNAAVAFNGDLGPSIANISTCTEEWNGTSWSVAGASTVSRKNIGAAGSQSSGLTFAGTGVGVTAATEEYSVSHLKTVEIDGV